MLCLFLYPTYENVGKFTAAARVTGAALGIESPKHPGHRCSFQLSISNPFLARVPAPCDVFGPFLLRRLHGNVSRKRAPFLFEGTDGWRIERNVRQCCL